MELKVKEIELEKERAEAGKANISKLRLTSDCQKLEIKNCNCDTLKWQEFWDSFEATINKSTTYEPSLKVALKIIQGAIQMVSWKQQYQGMLEMKTVGCQDSPVLLRIHKQLQFIFALVTLAVPLHIFCIPRQSQNQRRILSAFHDQNSWLFLIAIRGMKSVAYEFT